MDLPAGVWEAIAGTGAAAQRRASVEVAETLSVGSVEVEGSMAGIRAHRQAQSVVRAPLALGLRVT